MTQVAKQKPKLYEYTMCPFCWKVKAILLYKGIPYDPVEVNPMNKQELSFSSDYKKVPIYLDEKQINDSTPIMRHIDNSSPNRPVFETEDNAKDLEEKWLKWSDETLVWALVPVVYGSLRHAVQAFDYISKVPTFSWIQRLYTKYGGAVVMHLVSKKRAKKRGITNPISHFKTCINEWGEALNGKPYLSGDKPNGADLAIWGILRCVKELPAFTYIRENATVFDWFQRLEKQLS